MTTGLDLADAGTIASAVAATVPDSASSPAVHGDPDASKPHQVTPSSRGWTPLITC